MKTLTCALALLLLLSSCGKEVLDEHNPGRHKKDSTVLPDDEEIYSVEEFINSDFGKQKVWVAGYIVGACSRSINNAEWEQPFSHKTAGLIADAPSERNIERVVAIQLRNNELKNTFALPFHPENLHRRAAFHGTKQKYLGVPGMKKDIDKYGWKDLPRED